MHFDDVLIFIWPSPALVAPKSNFSQGCHPQPACCWAKPFYALNLLLPFFKVFSKGARGVECGGGVAWGSTLKLVGRYIFSLFVFVLFLCAAIFGIWLRATAVPLLLLLFLNLLLLLCCVVTVLVVVLMSRDKRFMAQQLPT